MQWNSRWLHQRYAALIPLCIHFNGSQLPMPQVGARLRAHQYESVWVATWVARDKVICRRLHGFWVQLCFQELLHHIITGLSASDDFWLSDAHPIHLRCSKHYLAIHINTSGPTVMSRSSSECRFVLIVLHIQVLADLITLILPH